MPLFQSNRRIPMAVKVFVLSDFNPDPSQAVTLEKNTAELPQKLIVDYWDSLRKGGANVADVVSRPVVSAVRYKSLDFYKTKREPQAVDLTNSLADNGFRAQLGQQVLFFKVLLPAG
jgi:hypothetical protein